MSVSFQFFLYYVFWPGMLGFILISTALLGSKWHWISIITWCLLWIIPPLGRYRRRFWLNCLDKEIQQLREGNQEEGAPGRVLIATLGANLIMFLSLAVGTNLAVYTLYDQLKEFVEHASSADQQTSEVPPEGSGIRGVPPGIYGAFGDHPDDPQRWEP